MTILAYTLAMPHAGKRQLVENRARQLGGIYAKHGAKVKITNIVSGPNTGGIAVLRSYADFRTASKAFLAVSRDPAHTELWRERDANPAGDLVVGRNIARVVHGEQQWDTHPVSLVRQYDLSRDKVAAALEILAEVTKLASEVDANVVALVPFTGDNMSAMSVSYQFRSIEHFGEGADTVGASEAFRALVRKAAGIGTLRSALLMVPL
jgi:hypothetical protein